MDLHPAGCTAGSGQGGASCTQSPQVPVRCCCPGALFSPCALSAYSLPKDSLICMWNNRVRGLVARDSRLESLILHLGKFLVTSGLYFPQYKMKLKIPALQIVMRIKPVVLSSSCTWEFPGKPQNANAQAPPRSIKPGLEGGQASVF